jgi:hypothetical protein
MKTKQRLLFRGAKTTLLLLSIITALASAPVTWAESATDLMEQGIYSEETKGNFNEAAQIYQKVISQASTDRALAAQAQYHLGVCQYKQNDFTAAEAAFQKVIKDFPDQKETVALARKYLAGAHPLQAAPWTDNEEMRLNIMTETGLKIGMADYTIQSGQTTNGQKTWRCNGRMSIGGMQSVSHSEVDAATFAPIHSTWKHSLLGKVDADYFADHAELKTAGKDEVKKLNFDGPVLDNEECVQWMRRLPLADGLKLDQSVLSSLGGQTVPIKWEVSGPEKVEAPAGTFNCYKITLNINQTFWYTADDHRTLVKFEGGGAVAELAGVTHRSPGEKAAYADATNGFSMTSPAGWLFDANDVEKENMASVSIIDPEAMAFSSVTVKRLDTLAPEDQKSLPAYVKHQIEKSAKVYKDFQVRADGQKERTVSGHPAISVVADYTEGKTKKVGYGVWSFGGTNGVYFEMLTAAEDFDALKPKLDSIIDSFQSK